MAEDAFIGEIRLFPFDWAPEGWLPCDGRLLDAGRNQALYSIISNIYGGNAPTTFALPDLRGHAVMGATSISGGGKLQLGESTGSDAVTLQVSQIPTHTHSAMATTLTGNQAMKLAVPTEGSRLSRLENSASGVLRAYVTQNLAGTPVALSPSSIGLAGQSGAHDNRQPFCVMNFCICVDGEYPAEA